MAGEKIVVWHLRDVVFSPGLASVESHFVLVDPRSAASACLHIERQNTTPSLG
jgi:hypothetical protein